MNIMCRIIMTECPMIRIWHSVIDEWGYQKKFWTNPVNIVFVQYFSFIIVYSAREGTKVVGLYLLA